MNRMRKTRKTRKQLKGGRFLGEGGYGCTFAEPPLPCWNPRGGVLPRRSSDQISKLMNSSLAQKAIVKNRMFRRIDPTQTYFISASDMDRCRPFLSAPHIQPTDELDRCSLNPADTLELLFFQMGGKDLAEITLTARDYAPFFKSLLHILKGMKLAHTNNIVHLDIKPENIVSHRLPTGEFQTRLIDYDLALDLTMINGRSDHELEALINIYTFWPFETIFIHPRSILHFIPLPQESAYVKQQKQVNLRSRLMKWYTAVGTQFSKGLVIGDGMPFSIARTGQIGSTAYLNDYAPTININDYNYKEYLKKVDIYMLGITLGLLMNRFFNYIMVSKDYKNGIFSVIIKVKTAVGEEYVDVNSLIAKGFSKEIQDWHALVESEIMVFYASMVDLMTCMDVSKRITIEEVVDIYTLFLERFDKYFTEDAITKYLVPLGAIQVDAQPVLPDVPSPTDLAKIKVSPTPSSANRTYQLPQTNLRKIQTNLFKGGKRTRKAHKKRGRK